MSVLVTAARGRAAPSAPPCAGASVAAADARPGDPGPRAPLSPSAWRRCGDGRHGARVVVLRAPALARRRGRRRRGGGHGPARARRRRATVLDILGLPVLVGLFGVAVALGTLGRSWSGPSTALVAPRRLGHRRGRGAGERGRSTTFPPPRSSRPVSRTGPSRSLVGLDIGPNLFVTGSLAWILWLRAAPNAGATPSIAKATRLGLVAAPLAMAGALGVLALAGHPLRIPKFSACSPQARATKVVAVGIAWSASASASNTPPQGWRRRTLAGWAASGSSGTGTSAASSVPGSVGCRSVWPSAPPGSHDAAPPDRRPCSPVGNASSRPCSTMFRSSAPTSRRAPRSTTPCFVPLGGGRVMDFGSVIGYGTAGRPSFWVGPLVDGRPNRELHIAFSRRDRATVRGFFDAARRRRGRSPARASAVARVPPRLLRGLRPRPRRQQRRGRLPHPGVTSGPDRRSRTVTLWPGS